MKPAFALAGTEGKLATRRLGRRPHDSIVRHQPPVRRRLFSALDAAAQPHDGGSDRRGAGSYDEVGVLAPMLGAITLARQLKKACQAQVQQEAKGQGRRDARSA